VKIVAIATLVAGLLAGVLGGYLWWGLPDRPKETELRDRADRLERQLNESQARAKATEKELEAERERRMQLETVLSQGKK
jgi:hypothetical protein